MASQWSNQVLPSNPVHCNVVCALVIAQALVRVFEDHRRANKKNAKDQQYFKGLVSVLVSWPKDILSIVAKYSFPAVIPPYQLEPIPPSLKATVIACTSPQYPHYFQRFPDVVDDLEEFRSQCMCSLSGDAAHAVACGHRRLENSVGDLVSISKCLHNLFSADYRNEGTESSQRSLRELNNHVQKICQRWGGMGLVTSEAIARLQEAVANFKLCSEVVQIRTKRVKGMETKLFCKQLHDIPLPAAILFARYLQANNKKGYHDMKEDFLALLNWVSKVIDLLEAFWEFDPIVGPICCSFTVLLAKQSTPSKYFLASALGFLFPVLAKASGDQELQAKVRKLKQRTWKILPHLEKCCKLYKDSFLASSIRVTPKWGQVRACAQANMCRNLNHARIEAFAELERLQSGTDEAKSTTDCDCGRDAKLAHFVYQPPASSSSSSSAPALMSAPWPSTAPASLSSSSAAPASLSSSSAAPASLSSSSAPAPMSVPWPSAAPAPTPAPCTSASTVPASLMPPQKAPSRAKRPCLQ